MNIVEILKSKEKVFIDADLENSKVKSLVVKVNELFVKMADEIEAFESYKTSQLHGEVHNLIVMSKSLAKAYSEWGAVVEANKVVANEEINKINQYNALKTELIENLKKLLEISKKMPIESFYDMRDGDYTKCCEGREIVIFNGHNVSILEHMICTLEAALVVSGHFNEIGEILLDVNYGAIYKNYDKCQAALTTAQLKQSKIDKIKKALDDMVRIGEKVVFFYTYKKSLTLIGLKAKDIQIREKALAKVYVPIKKYLQKELKVSFADICEVDVNEESFPLYVEE